MIEALPTEPLNPYAGRPQIPPETRAEVDEFRNRTEARMRPLDRPQHIPAPKCDALHGKLILADKEPHARGPLRCPKCRRELLTRDQRREKANGFDNVAAKGTGDARIEPSNATDISYNKPDARSELDPERADEESRIQQLANDVWDLETLNEARQTNVLTFREHEILVAHLIQGEPLNRTSAEHMTYQRAIERLRLWRKNTTEDNAGTGLRAKVAELEERYRQEAGADIFAPDPQYTAVAMAQDYSNSPEPDGHVDATELSVRRSTSRRSRARGYGPDA